METAGDEIVMLLEDQLARLFGGNDAADFLHQRVAAGDGGAERGHVAGESLAFLQQGCFGSGGFGRTLVAAGRSLRRRTTGGGQFGFGSGQQRVFFLQPVFGAKELELHLECEFRSEALEFVPVGFQRRLRRLERGERIAKLTGGLRCIVADFTG